MYKPTALLAFIFGFSFIAHAQEAAPAQNRDLVFSGRCEGADKTAVLSFVGDILIHNKLYISAMELQKESFLDIWEPTNVLIQKADFSVGNLEGPAALGLVANGEDRGDVGFIYNTDYAKDMKERGISDEVIKSTKANAVYSGTNTNFNYHPQVLTDLKKSGYDLLTTGNNHALDRRSLGIDRTLLAARAAGIDLVGTRPSNDPSAPLYHIARIQGLDVAFISCTEEINGFSDRKNQLLKCYEQASEIRKMISALSKNPSVDAVIVLPHWGVEYQSKQSQNQVNYGRMFLDAGAIAVIGSHPHVIQPWEKYITKDGRETLIMYSLGNFVAWQGGITGRTGVVAYLGLSKKDNQTVISGVGFTPSYRPGGEVIRIAEMNSEMRNYITPHFGTINYVPAKKPLTRFCK